MGGGLPEEGERNTKASKKSVALQRENATQTLASFFWHPDRAGGLPEEGDRSTKA